MVEGHGRFAAGRHAIMPGVESIGLVAARRLALARAGLLKPEWTGLPAHAGRGERQARQAAHRVIRRFSYLQLDTVSVAGARSHAIVLLARLEGFPAELAEELLQPGEPLFEYWGHEASWLPIELYPVLEFRRQELRHHPWWGDLVGQHPDVAERLLSRIRAEGPLRSIDLEGSGGGRGFWDLKLAKKVASALWSSGELAIRERRAFQRTFDLAERVIPEQWRSGGLDEPVALERLLLAALDGHGWAATGTLAQTWRLRNRAQQVQAALGRLVERGEVIACTLVGDGSEAKGWIRPADRELAGRLASVRPRRDRGVLLSPFDPLLWDRARVERLFGFRPLLEIFKPAARRTFGYYCLPVLAGERLVARVDLKAERKRGVVRVVACHLESDRAEEREAVRTALERYASALGLAVEGGP